MYISGTELSSRLRVSIASRVETLKEKYGRQPSLCVILVGNNPASESYVRGKSKACDSVGILSETIHLPEETTREELLSLIERLNADEGVDGILVQLPLPQHIDEAAVISAIAPAKDVDGFHPDNVAALWLRQPGLVPCTPKGIIKLLDEAGTTIDGSHAVVIGRSSIVGLPVAKLLLDRNATVTVAHSHSRNLAELSRQADILVVAVGKPKVVTADMVKEGATVIDVGINRIPSSGKLCGDVDTEEVEKKARCITPVPGGVGPMTICCLLENTVECFEKKFYEK